MADMVEAGELAAPGMAVDKIYTRHEFYIGLGLAVSSSFFIGASFIIKKKALLRLNRIGGVRAGAGGFGYLKEWIWWAGLICMGLGEAANFAAYAFAPASLVTPLGALSVLVAAVLSSKFLNEHLNLLGKMGCFLCIIGSTIIVLNSPKAVEVEDLEELIEKLKDSTFIIYVLLICGLSLFIGLYLAPRFGHTSVSIYLLLCSGVGSLTVMSCKALGLTIRDQISGKSNDFGTFLPYILIIITVSFIAIQMNYLNKALDIFNTSIVTPIYYVIFTSLVILASSILFKEFKHMTLEMVLGDICGFLVVIMAVMLLNMFKDVEISLDDIRGSMRPKRELIAQRDLSDDIIMVHTGGSGSDNSSGQPQQRHQRNSYGSNSNRDI